MRADIEGLTKTEFRRLLHPCAYPAGYRAFALCGAAARGSSGVEPGEADDGVLIPAGAPYTVNPPGRAPQNSPRVDGLNRRRSIHVPISRRRTVCLATICSPAGPTGTDPRPGETINLTRLAATMSGQEISEAVVELTAEKLGIVGRATEDGSLGWKLFLQHVADDAKGASCNLAG